ncbi:MAG: iron ABC transporter permease [Bacteroidota bacterium]
MLSRRAAWALGVPVALVLAGYVLWPNLATFRLGADAGVLADLFGRGRAAGTRALVNSVGVSVGTVLGGGVVGVSLAWALWRYDVPLRRTLGAVAALPLALPPLVGVLAFLFLYGESGMLPRGLQAAFGLEAVPFAFGGVAAVLAVHVYVFYVYFYLFAAAALRDLDASLLDASADLGASGWTTFRRVVLPLLRPALVGAGLLVFMLSMASFTAPLLFADGEPFLTTQIYQFKQNGALDRAASVSLVLTAICLLFLAGTEAGRTTVRGAAKGVGRRPGPIRSGGARALAGVGVGLFLVVILLPVGTVVLLSFVAEGTWTTQILPDTFTLDNYTALATEADVLAPITNSLWMAALATALNVVFGVATALVIVKGRVPGRGVLRALSLLPFAVPGTVLALALIVAFDEPSALAGGAVLIGTVWLLPLAYFVRHVPLVVRAAQASLESFDDRLGEASADLGASGWTTFRRVVLPAIGPGVIAGALLTFVTALGEFVASIMLYVYANRPIAVEIFSQLRIYEFGQAAAYSVLLMALVAASVAVSRAIGGRGVGG